MSPQKLNWECGGETRDFLGRNNQNAPLPTTGIATFHFHARSLSFWQRLSEWYFGQRHPVTFLKLRLYFCPIPVYWESTCLNEPGSGERWDFCEVVQLTTLATDLRERLLVPTPAQLRCGTVHISGEKYRGDACFQGSGGVEPRLILEGAENPQVMQVGPEGAQGLTLCTTSMLDPLATYSGERKIKNRVIWTNPDNHMEAGSLLGRRWISLAPEPTPPDPGVGYNPWSDRHSQLWPVHDGLLLNPVVLPKCVKGCRVIQPVLDARVDFSQVKLVQGEVFQRLQDELKPELDRVTAEFRTRP